MFPRHCFKTLCWPARPTRSSTKPPNGAITACAIWLPTMSASCNRNCQGRGIQRAVLQGSARAQKVMTYRLGPGLGLHAVRDCVTGCRAPCRRLHWPPKPVAITPSKLTTVAATQILAILLQHNLIPLSLGSATPYVGCYTYSTPYSLINHRRLGVAAHHVGGLRAPVIGVARSVSRGSSARDMTRE